MNALTLRAPVPPQKAKNIAALTARMPANSRNFPAIADTTAASNKQVRGPSAKRRTDKFICAGNAH